MVEFGLSLLCVVEFRANSAAFATPEAVRRRLATGCAVDVWVLVAYAVLTMLGESGNEAGRFDLVEGSEFVGAVGDWNVEARVRGGLC